MAPGLVLLAHILVLAFPSPATACWGWVGEGGSSCLAVESMWVTRGVHTDCTGVYPEAIPWPFSWNSHPPTCTLIATHIHSPKYLEPSKAGPQEHSVCACFV